MLNFNDTLETSLYTSQIDEIIQMFGVSAKYIKVNKRLDDGVIDKISDTVSTFTSTKSGAMQTLNTAEVFGDYANLELSDSFFNIKFLPANPEGFDDTTLVFNNFGLNSVLDCKIFITIEDAKRVTYNTLDLSNIINDVIELQNGSLFEITHVEPRSSSITTRPYLNSTPAFYELSLRTYRANDIKQAPNNPDVFDTLVANAKRDFMSLAGQERTQKFDNVFNDEL